VPPGLLAMRFPQLCISFFRPVTYVTALLPSAYRYLAIWSIEPTPAASRSFVKNPVLAFGAGRKSQMKQAKPQTSSSPSIIRARGLMGLAMQLTTTGFKI
jgi:hypothetical protein